MKVLLIATVVKNHIMEYKVIIDEVGLKAADTNEDGKITSLDYVAVKKYIMEN